MFFVWSGTFLNSLSSFGPFKGVVGNSSPHLCLKVLSETFLCSQYNLCFYKIKKYFLCRNLKKLFRVYKFENYLWKYF